MEPCKRDGFLAKKERLATRTRRSCEGAWEPCARAATTARQTYLRRLSATALPSAAKDPKRTPATEDASPV